MGLYPGVVRADDPVRLGESQDERSPTGSGPELDDGLPAPSQLDQDGELLRRKCRPEAPAIVEPKGPNVRADVEERSPAREHAQSEDRLARRLGYDQPARGIKREGRGVHFASGPSPSGAMQPPLGLPPTRTSRRKPQARAR